MCLSSSGLCRITFHHRIYGEGLTAPQVNPPMVKSLQSTEVKKHLSNHRTAAVTKHGDHTFELGNNITVHICKGDITSEKTHVIVNTTNRQMRLDGSAVGRALLNKAGKDLQNACDEVIKTGRNLTEGKVIDTRPGKLKCKRVFHIVFDRQAFVAVIIACIKKVIELKFISIAFPGIGTGAEGVPPAYAARDMIKGLEKCNSPYEINVRIVLFDDAVCSAFKTAISDHLSSSWIGRAWRAGKSMIGLGPQQPEGEKEDEPMEVDADIRSDSSTSESSYGALSYASYSSRSSRVIVQQGSILDMEVRL